MCTSESDVHTGTTGKAGLVRIKCRNIKRNGNGVVVPESTSIIEAQYAPPVDGNRTWRHSRTIGRAGGSVAWRDGEDFVGFNSQCDCIPGKEGSLGLGTTKEFPGRIGGGLSPGSVPLFKPLPDIFSNSYSETQWQFHSASRNHSFTFRVFRRVRLNLVRFRD